MKNTFTPGPWHTNTIEVLEKQIATLKAELQWIAALTISATDHQNNTNRLLNIRDRAMLALDKTDIEEVCQRVESVIAKAKGA